MALRSDKIEKILKKVLKNSHLYGVISFQELDTPIKKFPFCAVINSAKKHENYGHWTCLYAKNEKNGLYFDSFGVEPWGEILSFLRSNMDECRFNRRIIACIS